MYLFVFLFLFVAVDGKLNRTATPCTVYNSDQNTKVPGTVFSGTFKYKNSQPSNVELCCLPSVADRSIEFGSKSTRAACCQQLVGSKCLRDNGHRPCPSLNCVRVFTGVNKIFDQIAKPPTATICLQNTKLPETGTISKTDIVQYKSSQSCADPSKSILISSVKGSNKPEAYNWCCSKDITKSLDEDPKKVCCGLAASQAINGHKGQTANLESPSCCRKLDGRSPCNIITNAKIFDKQLASNSSNSVCGGEAGSSKTKNLAENLPALAPIHYFYPKDFGDKRTQDDFFEPKTIYACDKSGNKILYALQDFITRFNREISSPNIAVCCSKDAMFLDAKSMASDCCITYTKAGNVGEKGMDAPGGPKFDKSFYKCSKSQGSIDTKKNVLVYKSCSPESCDSSGTLTDKTTLETFDVSSSKVSPFYGVYKWEVNKYSG